MKVRRAGSPAPPRAMGMLRGDSSEERQGARSASPLRVATPQRAVPHGAATERVPATIDPKRASDTPTLDLAAATASPDEETLDGVLSAKAELDLKIESLEGELATVGDDAQLANIDLQNQLQKQQQTLQTMSNVSKMLHDTAMAIIRKIG